MRRTSAQLAARATEMMAAADQRAGPLPVEVRSSPERMALLMDELLRRSAEVRLLAHDVLNDRSMRAIPPSAFYLLERIRRMENGPQELWTVVNDHFLDLKDMEGNLPEIHTAQDFHNYLVPLPGKEQSETIDRRFLHRLFEIVSRDPSTKRLILVPQPGYDATNHALHDIQAAAKASNIECIAPELDPADASWLTAGGLIECKRYFIPHDPLKEAWGVRGVTNMYSDPNVQNDSTRIVGYFPLDSKWMAKTVQMMASMTKRQSE